MSQKAELVIEFNNVAGGQEISFLLALDGITPVTHTFEVLSIGNAPVDTSTRHQFSIGASGFEDIGAKTGMINELNGLSGFSTYYETFSPVGSGELVGIRAKQYVSTFDFGLVSPDIGILLISQEDTSVTSLEAAYSKTDNLCNGVSLGAINVTVWGGADPYSYSWADGPTTQDRTGLPAGTYTLTITDALGTTKEVEVTITQPANAISITPTKTNVTCNGADNGTISLSVSGGTPGYTYSWADGPTTGSRSSLPPGTYTVTVTDSVGCSNEEEVTITEPTLMSVTATVAGNEVSIAVTGGTPGYTFLWSDGDTSQERVGVTPGDYDITITDANGCVAFESVTVASYRFYFSRNPITLELTAADPETKANLSFVCEVWLEEVYESENYTKIITLEQPADSDGHTVFDVQAVLNAYVEPSLPTYNQNTVTLAGNIFKRYYLKYTEKYGEPPALNTFTQVNLNYVVLGGLSYEEYADNTFFDTYQAAQKPFFTWEPNNKLAFTDQPEYLYFMVDSFSVSSFKSKVKIYYTDGTSSTQTFATTSSTNRYEIYIIPAGHDQLDLASYSGTKTVKAWDIFCTDSLDNIISEVRKYKLDNTVYRSKRYVLYLNSLGGFNTLAAVGKAKITIDSDDVTADKILPFDYAVSDAPFTVLEKSATKEIRFTSGYKSKEYVERLQDLLISRALYLVENGRHLPVKKRSGNSELVDEESNLYFIELRLEPPTIYNYTPYLG